MLSGYRLEARTEIPGRVGGPVDLAASGTYWLLYRRAWCVVWYGLVGIGGGLAWTWAGMFTSNKILLCTVPTSLPHLHRSSIPCVCARQGQPRCVLTRRPSQQPVGWWVGWSAAALVALVDVGAWLE